jgi:hypothetical protein
MLPMLLLQIATGASSFSVGDVLQILSFAAISGGAFATLRNQGKRIDENKTETLRLIDASETRIMAFIKDNEVRHDKQAERSTQAIESLSRSITDLTAELREGFAEVNGRIKPLEK